MDHLIKKILCLSLALAFYFSPLPTYALEMPVANPIPAFSGDFDDDSLGRRGFGRDGRRMSAVYLSETLSIPNDPYYFSKGSLYSDFTQLDDLWGIKLLNSEAAWDFTRGAGVVVAVIDSGVYLNHAELQGNIWFNQKEKDGLAGIDDDGNGFIDDVNGWDFVEDDKDPSDFNGHGTHVAGIIGALKDNNIGITGIAPEADIMAVRVLDSSGEGSFADVASGIRYAAMMGARVINLSLGGSIVGLPQSDMDLLLSAVRYARDLGAIVVTAVGNSGRDIFKQVPARFDEVISVGALRHQYDTFYGSGPLGRANFSDKGKELDFMAPGVDILSLAAGQFTYTGYKSFFDDTSYYSASDGTSMATPMVSGAIALLLAQNPLQTFSDIYRRLKFSSTDLETSGFDNNTGWGAVNVFKALSEDYYDDGKIKRRYYPDGREVRILEYWPSTDRVKIQEIYLSGIFQKAEEFYLSGDLFKETLPSAEAKTYYENGALQSIRQANGDAREYYQSGNISSFFYAATSSHVFYLDENFYGNDDEGYGQGRVSRALYSDGSEVRYLAYFGHTDRYRTLERYVNGERLRTETYDRDGRLLKEADEDGESRVYKYKRFFGKRELSLSTVSVHNPAGVLIEYQSYDSSERLIRRVFYNVEEDKRVVSYTVHLTYNSDGHTAKEVRYEYAEGILPFRLERVLKDHTVFYASSGATVYTSRKITAYIYNRVGRRYTGSVETFAYHSTMEQGDERLESHTINRYELNSNGNGAQRVFYENTRYESDGQTVKQFERKAWIYYQSGRVKRQEVFVNSPHASYHRIYEYDTQGRVTETHTLTHYSSGNIKTECLEKAKIIFEYKDEDFDGEGKGRLAKKINADGSYEIYGAALVSSASTLETVAFGGTGFFEMQDVKNDQRALSSPTPIDKEKILAHLNPLA